MEHLKQWIGRTEDASEVLTPTLVEKFNATLDRTSSLQIGDPAPPLIHLCLAQPALATAELGKDGHPSRGGFLPPVPLPRRMWAGGTFQFTADIRVGDTVTRRSTVKDVKLKEGRSGTLCFVTVEHHIKSNDKAVLRERQDLVYREAAAPRGSKSDASEPAAKGDFSKTITPSPALLFRFSALTFNGHRIHYDAPYARDVEGYPGLVVHGPLQALLLYHFASEWKGSVPAHFSFRSLSPIFDDQNFTINAREEGSTLQLWSAAEGGPVAMQATADW